MSVMITMHRIQYKYTILKVGFNIQQLLTAVRCTVSVHLHTPPSMNLLEVENEFNIFVRNNATFVN